MLSITTLFPKWRRLGILVIWLVGCTHPGGLVAPGGTIPPSPGSTPATGITTTTTLSTAVQVYDNPIFPGDFPDPFVLPVGDEYYAYSTNVGTTNVPVLRLSADFSTYEQLGDALPRLPEWAAWQQSLTWAPAVLERNEVYILYYTARYREAGRQCISRAVSAQPAGPFRDDSTQPFVCQLALGGSIDPSPFVDTDGVAYLLWKNDGNCCGRPVSLWVQRLTDDGLALEGEPVELIRRDQLWESPLVEAPVMVEHDDQYYLFYSGNWWESHTYAVGYAVCESVTGPCVKPQREPIFEFTQQVMGPGGQELFHDAEGNLWMAYHAWTAPLVGYPEGERSLRIEPVTFVDGVPTLPGPTVDPQPVP
jgi:beta-xylosidase